MLNLKKSQKLALTKDEILDYYYRNCKYESEFKIGLEYEKISVDSETLKNASYEELRQVIVHFAMIKGWEVQKDDGVTVGAHLGRSSVSLEPGGQFEISLEPKKDIEEIENETKSITELLDSIAHIYNIRFLPVGITPRSTYQNIDILKKKRYLLMADYLPAKGKFSPIMMRETAGVQVNCDYRDEDDALLKLGLCIKMSPFLTGFFANSPIRNNRLTNYKSFRALAWRYTDNDRCGIFYKNLDGKGFEGYIDAVLDVPLLFIERQTKRIPINGSITFREFMKKGHDNYRAELKDYLLHASLCFPDVRLKNCLEIRNHDSQKLPMTMSVCAFYKGILHSKHALLDVQKLLKEFSYMDILDFGFLATKEGLNFSANGKDAFKITEKLFKISQGALGFSEKKHLDAPIEMLKNREIVADAVLKNGVKDAQGLVEFLSSQKA